MNPPGTKPCSSARFPWTKGVMRLSQPGTLRPGSTRDFSGDREIPREPNGSRPRWIAHRKRMDTGITFCSDAPNRGESAGVWVGRWAGPVLFLILGAALLCATPATANDWSGARGLLSDGLPRYSQPLREGMPDLALTKPNERIAEALAAFAEGLAAEENADYERAMEAYQRALGLDASNTELAVKVAFVLARQGHIPQGIDILKDAEKASPKDLLPPLCLSQIYGKFLNKPQLAERYAQKAMRLDARNIGPYLALYEIYMTSGQASKAVAILKRAAEAPTQEPTFWLQLAEAQIQHEGKTGPAFPKEAVGPVKALLDKALKGNEGNAAVVTRAADAYVLMWQVDVAAPLYEQVVTASRAQASDEMLAVRDKLARCLLASDTPEKGVEVLRKMIADAPQRLESYELLAEWFVLREKLEEALQIYRQALDVDGSQAKFHLRVAQLQLEREDGEGAVRTLVRARQFFPRSAYVTSALALALSRTERHKEALPIFEQAMAEGRYSNDEVISSEFFFEYGMAAERSGDLELAAAQFRRCIEMDPENAGPAYNYLGYMWADEGVHLEEALELIQLALRKEPDNAAYLDSLGWVYYRMGQYPQAIEYLKKALERMVPEEAILYDHLGDALNAAGKQDEAIANWKKALELDPDNAKIKEKLIPPTAP